MKIVMALLLAVSVAGALAAPGVKIVQEFSDERSAEKSTHSMFMTDKRLKAVIGESNLEVVFDAAKERLVIVDHASKSYKVLDKAFVAKMKTKLGEVMKMIEQMPPEQRQMVMNMMKGRLPGFTLSEGKNEYIRTQQEAKVGKWQTRQVDVNVKGTKRQELWVATPTELGIKEDDMKVLGDLAAFIKDFTSIIEFPNMHITHSGQDVGGVPVKSVSFEGGKVKQTTTLLSVNKQDVPDSEFEIPASYKEEKIDMGG